MPVINRIADFAAEMAAWRHDIHAHPETAFEEHRTAEIVARLLESFGIAVERGVARTGIIGTLQGAKPGGRAIALRADMDALHVHEKTGAAYASQNQGRMHACGHDGHTAMLLGAAKYLAETKNFAGTLHFIFQPAEENEGGARLMVEEGVLQRYPVEAVWGMHNWPSLP
jgi:amidohydrolase